MGFNRYDGLGSENGIKKLMPFIKISESISDKYEIWNSNRYTFELLSYNYYDSPFYDIFILCGNPEYLSEHEIPDGTVIRIPFPLDRVKEEYYAKLKLLTQI